MDLEALRKLNTLTKELQKHGITNSSQDALREAEHILNPIGDTPKITPTPPLHIDPTTHDALAERKYKLLLEMNNKRFDEAFATLHMSVTMLTQEVGRLKTELDNLHTTRFTQSPTHTEQSSIKEPDQPAPAPAKKEVHPRQGGFAPGDISIEKMFYFGHK